MLHTVDVGSSKVGCNASIRQLGCGGEADEERQERGVEVLH